MSPVIKKILLIIALLLVAALIAFGFYYLFYGRTPGGPFAPAPVGTPTAPGVLPPAGERPGAVPTVPGEAPGAPLPAVAPGAGILPTVYRPETVTKISDDFASFQSLAVDGSLRYHNVSDGKFYRLTPSGAVALSDQIFYNVQKVTWSRANNKAVLEYPDNRKIVYNFDTREQASLPQHWSDFSWSSAGDQLAAKSIGLSPENRWLITTRDDGTDAQLIQPLGNNADKVKVDWSPSRQVVALSQTGAPQGVDRREVLLIGLNNENFKSLVVEGLNFNSIWSPTGKKLLYNVDSGRTAYKPELWVVNAYGEDIGSNRTPLQINTWADKCSFAGDNILFCAVPRDLPVGAGMSPAATAQQSYYDLLRVDLASGAKVSIPLGGDYTIKSVSYEPSGNKLFFTDYLKPGIFEANL